MTQLIFPRSYEDVAVKIVDKYLNYNDGFFIEAGGADGITQSNTWHLEMYRNWKGILVEPNPDAAQMCNQNRQNSTVFNCALVSDDCEENEIEMYHRKWYAEDPGLTSSVHDSNINNEQEWQKIEHKFLVQTATLNNILESLDMDGTVIDFLSLDVEGYELEVIKGLNLKKYCPKVILVEWHLDIQDIINLLDDTHKLAEQLSKHDYVFIAKE